MRANERAKIDLAVAEAGLHRRVLARRALAVVLVADGAPSAMPASCVVLGDVGERLRLRRRAGPCPSPAVAGERVDHAEEQVAGDVLEVAAVLEPRAGRRDVVGGALALGLQQHRQVDVVVAVPRRRTARAAASRSLVGLDDDVDRREPSAGGATKPDSPGSKPLRGQLVADRRLEPDGSPSASVSVSVQRVEVERAGQRQRDDGLGRVDERQRVGVAVVALREVAVERVDDRVDRRRRSMSSRSHWPMHGPQALASTVRADRLEVGEQAVALDRGPHLLGAGRDQQLAS